MSGISAPRGGLIPTCAGSTLDHAGLSIQVGAHPHVRGEHTRNNPVRASLTGSSPRARGAPHRDQSLHRSRGLIPTCAGSTRCKRSRWRSPRAHPHVRGEHKAGDPVIAMNKGSSPRARGAPYAGLRTYQGKGLIPTCAGSTPPQAGCRHRRWAHPHVRGEHYVMTGLLERGEGSSPRARGAQWELRPETNVPGLIPTCAGSTPGARSRLRGTGAHPHVRGEHTS